MSSGVELIPIKLLHLQSHGPAARLGWCYYLVPRVSVELSGDCDARSASITDDM